MRINHNIASLNTYRMLTLNNNLTAKSLEKLSSGLRINRAGDDAAGLAISEKMRGQIRGLEQAARNAQDGISMIQTAEGALNEVHSILQRMRELAVQAANDSNTEADRNEIQKEINQLTSEINRIGNTTEFNTQKLLDGSKMKVADTAAVMTSAAITGDIVLSATPTSGYAKGASLSFGINLYNAYGASATGSKDISGGVNIDESHNELTLTIDGTQKTIAITVADYTGNVTNLINEINTQLDAVFGNGVATASLTDDKYLTITTDATGAGHTISIDGGDAASVLFGANWNTTDITNQASADANNNLTFKVDGTDVSITIAAGTYNNIDALKNAVNAAITGAGKGSLVVASSDGNALVLTSKSTGTSSTVNTFGGSAQAVLGFSSPTLVSGNSASNQFTMYIDGETINVTMEEQTFTDKVAFAGALQAKINAATKTAADVTVTFNSTANKLTITSGTTGTTSQIKLDASSTGFAAATGLTAGAEAKGEEGAGAQVNFQIGANMLQGMVIQISDMRSQALLVSSGTVSGDAKSVTGVEGSYFVASKVVTNGTDNEAVEYSLDVSSYEKATAAVQVLDNAIQAVSAERSKLGAYQNRLEHTINNLGTSAENLTAAESRIRDVDMAKEMMEFTKMNILTQAATAMLAQANQQPQSVLQLLGR